MSKKYLIHGFFIPLSWNNRSPIYNLAALRGKFAFRMLQRIQTIFLLLAIIFNLATLFVPMWELSAGDQIEMVNGMAESAASVDNGTVSFFEHQEPFKSVLHISFFTLVVLTSLYFLWLIFQYSDRVRQMRFAYAGVGMLMVEILVFVLLSQQPADFLTAVTASKPAFGFAFPIVAFFMVFLAIRGIKKDHELVRSEDRIR